MSYTIVKSGMAKEVALGQCKGSYQRGLINGDESLSGSTLKGKALSYKGHYMRSASNLMERLRKVGVAREIAGKHGKRILEIDFWI